jgi:acrylyl-CoA reductase (NADPH)
MALILITVTPRSQHTGRHDYGPVVTETFRAFTATQDGDAVARTVTTMSTDDLPADGLLIAVERSSVNYKDGLATIPKGRVARISPLIPGIDLAGTVVDGSGDFPTGTAVLAHGYEIGTARHGGFAAYARVPAEWLVRMPSGLDAREAMAIGTAGFTAALSVLALEDHGLTPAAGPVLVTGATGGVGSSAVSILAGRGYEVVASTGKADAEPFLRGLGAASIVTRDELSAESKPLESMTWAGAVDCVGGLTLANVLSKLRYGGAVAASGLTGGTAVPTTVMPFILRGVSLLGIDSVELPVERRRQVWELLGADLKPKGLESIVHDVTLDGLTPVLDSILQGAVTGRYVVDVQA